MLPHEKVLQQLQYALTGIANTSDEVRGLLVSVVWDPSMKEALPFGSIIFKQGIPVTPELVLDSLRQNSRLATGLLGQSDKWVDNIKKELVGRDEQIRALQEEVRSLKGSSGVQEEDLRSGHP